MDILSLDHIKRALAGRAAAFRSVTAYQPAGGPGDKIFPVTYEGGTHATESRHIDGAEVPCVLVDSVQSQANRMEAALLDEWEAGAVSLPVIVVDFMGCDLPKSFRVTSLEAPHRIADALLRDSLLDGVPFRQSAAGKRIDLVDVRNATALFELCPTALVFGMWDSTGPRGGSRQQVPARGGVGVHRPARGAGEEDQQPHRPGAGAARRRTRVPDRGWRLDVGAVRGRRWPENRPAALRGQSREHRSQHRRRRVHHQPGAADHGAVAGGPAPAPVPD